MAQNVTAYIGLGSNLNDCAEFLRNAIELLNKNEHIDVTAVSDFLQTPPLAGLDQPDYLNAVVQIQTSLSPTELLKATTDIETSLGRVRKEKWSPRTIDLDILLYGSDQIDSPDLTIPHRQMHLRSFVLKPLASLAPDLLHPVLNEFISTLAGRLNGRDFVINPQAPQLISVAGVIGVGKTTLVKNLAEILNAEMIFEDYDKNPFLSQVYAGKTELALDCQRYFLSSRLKQLSLDKLQKGKLYLNDYIFEKELIYAKRYLTPQQLSEYTINYENSIGKVSPPVLTIYLYDSPENCLERIHSRNRPYEQTIELSFLKNFAADYDDLFRDWKTSPAIRISISDFDARQKSDVERLAKQVKLYITGTKNGNSKND